MPTITITMTLKQAEAVCLAVAKADPTGIYTCDIIRKIDTIAKEEIAKMNAEKEIKK